MARRGRPPKVRADQKTGSTHQVIDASVEVEETIPPEPELLTPRDVTVKEVIDTVEDVDDTGGDEEATDDTGEQAADDDVVTDDGGADVPDDDMPEKYKGKTAKQIADENIHLQKKLGEQGTELGNYRHVFDQKMKEEAAARLTAEADAKGPMSERIFSDTDAALAEIEDRAVRRATGAAEAKATASVALTKFDTDFPDSEEIVNSLDFQDWAVKAFPQKILAAGHSDPEVAAHVLGEYRKHTNAGEIAENGKKDTAIRRKTAAQAASIQPSKTKADMTPKYTRAGVVHMQRYEPERYRAELDAISAAYANGDVK